jgi:hypothetical protein
MLKKPKLHQLPSTSVNSTSQENESDGENEPPTKKIREVTSSVPQLIRYDGSNHYGLSLCLVLTILDVRTKSVLRKHIVNAQNAVYIYVLIQLKIVLLNITMRNNSIRIYISIYFHFLLLKN